MSNEMNTVESVDDTVIDVRGLNLWYGEKQALMDVTMPVRRNRITALIGPSGCGKSTLLRSMNRMNDLVDGCRIEGQMLFHGEDMYAPDVDINALRSRVGMISSNMVFSRYLRIEASCIQSRTMFLPAR